MTRSDYAIEVSLQSLKFSGLRRRLRRPLRVKCRNRKQSDDISE
jgi:hypothetical protein